MKRSGKLLCFVLTFVVLLNCFLFSGTVSFADVEARQRPNITIPVNSAGEIVASDSQKQQAVVKDPNTRAQNVIGWTWSLIVSDSEIRVKCDVTVGINYLHSAYGTLIITNASGNSSIHGVSQVLPFYNKEWVFSYPISSSTVQETVSFVGTVQYDLGMYDSTREMELVRDNFAGGAYNSISSLDGQKHHIFSSYVYDNIGVNKYDYLGLTITGPVSKYGDAPVILMYTPDHQRTASWGSSASAIAYRNQQLSLVRNGKYLEAVNMDIADIQSKFGNKYDYAIFHLQYYIYYTLNWYDF